MALLRHARDGPANICLFESAVLMGAAGIVLRDDTLGWLSRSTWIVVAALSLHRAFTPAPAKPRRAADRAAEAGDHAADVADAEAQQPNADINAIGGRQLSVIAALAYVQAPVLYLLVTEGANFSLSSSSTGSLYFGVSWAALPAAERAAQVGLYAYGIVAMICTLHVLRSLDQAAVTPLIVECSVPARSRTGR